MCYAVCGAYAPVLLDIAVSPLDGGQLLPSNLTKGGLPNGYLFRPYSDWLISRWHYWLVFCIQKAEVTAPPSKECGHICTNL